MAWAILTEPVALRLLVVPFVPVTVAVAVMGSDPLQPFAVYVAVAVPVIVETDPAGRVEPTGPKIVAVPRPTHLELNTIVTGVPASSVPDWLAIVAVMVAEPPAPICVDGLISRTPDLKALPLPLPKEMVVVVVPVPVPVPVVVPVVVPVPTKAALSLPPHAVNPIATASRTVVEANFLMYHPKLMTVRPILVPVSRR